jgi:hypothetical protein
MGTIVLCFHLDLAALSVNSPVTPWSDLPRIWRRDGTHVYSLRQLQGYSAPIPKVANRCFLHDRVHQKPAFDLYAAPKWNFLSRRTCIHPHPKVAILGFLHNRLQTHQTHQARI